MPKRIRMNYRSWVGLWAALCLAGLAVTARLSGASEQDRHAEVPVSAECSDHIADIERQLAKSRQESDGEGTLGFSRIRVGTEDDCGEELRNHFGGDR